MYLFINTTCL